MLDHYEANIPDSVSDTFHCDHNEVKPGMRCQFYVLNIIIMIMTLNMI